MCYVVSFVAITKQCYTYLRFQDELSVLQKQFTVVQKKLLVQYGSLPPGDCEPLEFLMKDTHNRLITVVHELIKCKETVCRYVYLYFNTIFFISIRSICIQIGGIWFSQLPGRDCR